MSTTSTKKTGKKGFETEELVRSYFLGAGFFVVRGVRLKNGGDELTDIDLWLYERSATLARRRIIIDIKDNDQPKAAERLFFVKGLAEVIQVEATGIVTSDTRRSLRELARKHNVLWIDNADLQRLKTSEKLLLSSRISDEELYKMIADVDSSRSSKVIRDSFSAIKSSVADRFGPSCANAALDGVQNFANRAIEAHPRSSAAQLFCRLTYLCAAIAGAALDFTSGEIGLRPHADRLAYFTKAIRFGEDAQGTEDKLRWAEAVIRDFAPNGAGTAEAMRTRFLSALQSVPAESLADVVAKMANTDRLFRSARDLECAAYAKEQMGFDALSIDAKSLLGAILDFAGVDRSLFASSWESSLGKPSKGEEQDQRDNTDGDAAEKVHGKFL